MLLHINGKYTITKLKSSLFSKSVVLNRPSLSISSSRSRYEADAISVTEKEHETYAMPEKDFLKL
jgi:hypothetical protein